jgi:signal transduction histidine kinase
MSALARQMLVVALLLAAVIGLFVAAQSGRQRLEEATRRVELVAQRQHALAEVSQLLRQAESSERGYLLVGKPEYFAPFEEAAAKFAPALQSLDELFATAGPQIRADIEQLKRLSDAKFTELRRTADLFRTAGRGAAMSLVRTDVGALTMSQIEDLVHEIEARDTEDIFAASRSWRTNRWASVATTSAALVASMGLLLLLSRLGLRHLRSKELEAEQLAARQAELEQLVEHRTAELSELSTHLQSLAEQEKAALSRELHDELGGLLVAARMDVSWLEERLGTTDAEVQTHFRRVHEALKAGVDVKRRVIESLRPTLLDNLGLFPALHWQVRDCCQRAGLKYVERYPEGQIHLTSEASIVVFRIVQEALTNILKHARAHSVEVSVEPRAPWLLLRIRDDGVGLPVERLRALRSHGLAAMRVRAAGLGGRWQIDRPKGGGTQIEIRLPLKRVLAEALPRVAVGA